MHISDIQCIYNWSAKHQIPTLKTVVHCIICSITHKLKPTSRIYVQMIYKSSTSYLEHCRRRYPYRGRLPAVFNISITGFFLWKTRLKIEIKKQNCNFNMSLISNQGNLLLFESKFKCYPIIALHCMNNKKNTLFMNYIVQNIKTKCQTIEYFSRMRKWLLRIELQQVVSISVIWQ